MNLLKITTCYPSYVKDLYCNHPGLGEKSFAEQKAAFDYDAFGWADYWSHALTPLGYRVSEISYNVPEMQRAWAKENSLPDPAGIDLKEIALAQIRQFNPDILWFDDTNADLLKRIRDEVPSIKLVLGWVGSAIPRSDVWQHIDLILSCSPESVQWMKNHGFPAAHLHHGFESRINDRLINRPKRIDFSFIGQLVRGSHYHLHREKMLEALSGSARIEIFSPSADYGWRHYVQACIKATNYELRNALSRLGLSDALLKSLPVLKTAYKYDTRPLLPVNARLKPFIKPPVFGLDMYQVIRDSEMTLNIHADSSPLFASNMRLFETTGVGTCLITDWKDNLPELFEPDKEVVVYKNAEECLEKVRWLLDHAKEREEIAKAGQMRTLREHTFSRRAVILDEMIKTRI